MQRDPEGLAALQVDRDRSGRQEIPAGRVRPPLQDIPARRDLVERDAMIGVDVAGSRPFADRRPAFPRLSVGVDSVHGRSLGAFRRDRIGENEFLAERVEKTEDGSSLRGSSASAAAFPAPRREIRSSSEKETRAMIGIRNGAVVVGLLAGWALGLGQAGQARGAEDKIRVLIVDGQNNHNWRAMTPPMKADLEKIRPVHGRRGDHARPESLAIGLGRVPSRFLQVRRGAQQLQRRAVAGGGPQGARGLRRQGRRAGDHPRGQQRVPRLARLQRDDRPGLAQSRVTATG